MATIGSPAINRAGAYGNVTTGYRCLIELANPASGSGYIVSVSAFFAIVKAGQTGYLFVATDEGGGVFSSRSHLAVTFPSSVGLATWDTALDFQDGDYIGIALPIAAVNGDIGIDVGDPGGSGVRRNLIAASFPIVSGTFGTLDAAAIMSLEGTTGSVTNPSVTTQAVSSIVTTTATGNGNITGLGTPAATQHGHCWNAAGTPTTSDSKTQNGVPAAVGAFTSSITGLTIGTRYYVRSYITSPAGTFYGGQVSFTAGRAVFPTDAITRVTSLIHRYDRRKRTYTLELVLGEVTSDFGLPEWSSVPISAAQVEPTVSVPEPTAPIVPGIIPEPTPQPAPAVQETPEQRTQRLLTQYSYEANLIRQIQEYNRLAKQAGLTPHARLVFLNKAKELQRRLQEWFDLGRRY